MKTHTRSLLAALALLTTLNLQPLAARAQGTAFSYQGRLNSAGGPASGSYDLTFTLFATNATGVAVGGPVTNAATAVSNGLFNATVDFGNVFTGGSNWLEIAVSTNGANNFTTLAPRQQLTPVPYAIFATTASNVSGTVLAAQLSGAVANGNLPSSPTVPGTVTAGSFSGNGANVTNVNAAALNGLSAGSFWQLGGNNVSAGQIFGSTNSQAVQIVVGGQQALIITTNPADSADFIGGSPANAIDAGVEGSVIAGGGTTNFSGLFSANHVSANFSSIGGGSGNQVQPGSDHSFIGAGLNNTIYTSGSESFIGGGQGNTIQPQYSQGSFAGGWSFIGGGQSNSVWQNVTHSLIGGGQNNKIEGGYEVGDWNANGQIDAYPLPFGANYSTIVGGYQNTIFANDPYSVIGGGQNNSIQDSITEHLNYTYDPPTFNGSADSVIGGGYQNTIQPGSLYSLIGGGYQNVASGTAATVAGYQNQALNGGATVAGGGQNTASGLNSSVGGGSGNTVTNQGAVIGGGYNNTNTGVYATIPGGYENLATGAYSFAAGQQAQATNQGAFVWADSQNALFASTNNNTFNVRAQGGARFVTSGAGMTVDGQPVFTGSNGTGLTNLNASQLSGGTIPLAQLPAAVVTNTETGVTLSGAFNGNGGGLTNLNASNFSSGTIPLAQLPAASVTNTETGVTLSGAFSGNGSGLTNLNAAQVSGTFTGMAVTGSVSGGFGSDVALMQNLNTSGNTGPTLRLIGNGNSPNGVLSVSSQGTGLIAQFGNAIAFVADLTTNGTFEGTGFNGGTIRVGSNGTTITNMETGQAIMPASSLQETNFAITFPTAFSSSPKIVFSIANDPGFQGVSDVFSACVSSNSPSAFMINVYRLNGTSWSQSLRINWQAWQ